MEITKHEPGMFSWADLATPDVKGSENFYTKVLEVDAIDVPVGEGMAYVILNKGGKKVCAMYQMNEEMKQQMGGHPVWQSYFTVTSADYIATRVKKLGGTVAQEPFDVFEAGRMLVSQDPTGAVFAVWQPKTEIGAEVFGEPGALGWTELYTGDTQAASQFYAGVFGWSAVPHDGEYTVFEIGDKPAAGMMAIKKEWGEVPPNWSIYFVVANLDDTIEKAKDMGAKEVIPPMTVEDVGRFVFLQDPQRGYVAFIQPAEGTA